MTQIGVPCGFWNQLQWVQFDWKKIAIDDFFFSIHKDWGRQKEYGTEHVDLQMEMNNAMTN